MMSIMVTATWKHGEAPEDATVIQGGNPAAPSWSAFVSLWQDPWTPVALRDAAAASGQTNGRDLADGYFEMSDGTAITMTARACADLLAAAADKREHYMNYL